MVNFKQITEFLGGLESLLEKAGSGGDIQGLQREVEVSLRHLRTIVDFVNQVYLEIGEQGEQEGGAKLEAALALEEIERRPRDGMALRSRPIFIVGHSRSGTTLLAWLLDSHPNIAAVPENMLCSSLLSTEDVERTVREQQRLPIIQAQVTLEALGETRDQFLTRIAQLVDGIFADYAARCGKQRWVYKDVILHPSLDLLDVIFGYQAQYIVIVRHGFDVALSASERFGRRWGTPIVREASLNLRNYVLRWVEANETLMDF